MSFLDYLSQLQQQNTPTGPSVYEMQNKGIDSVFAGLKTRFDADKADKEAKAKAALDAEALKRKTAMEDRKMLAEDGQRFLSANDNESAAAVARQLAGVNAQLGFKAVGPGIVGADTGAYDIKTHNPLRDFSGQGTTDALTGIFGTPKGTDTAPGHSIIRNDKVVVTAPFAPRSVGRGGLLLDGNNGEVIGQGMAPAAPAARGGGRSSGGGGGGGSRRGGSSRPAREAKGPDPMARESKLQALMSKQERQIRAKYENADGMGEKAADNPLYHKEMQQFETQLRQRFGVPVPVQREVAGPQRNGTPTPASPATPVPHPSASALQRLKALLPNTITDEDVL